VDSYAQTESKVYAGNLSWNTDTESLRAAFESFGNITDCIVMTDRETGRSRGFGYVTFDSASAVKDAIAALDNTELDGRTIRVNEANTRGGGGGGGGRGGGYNSRASGW
jgi:RNA recognition motif-containing protein